MVFLQWENSRSSSEVELCIIMRLYYHTLMLCLAGGGAERGSCEACSSDDNLLLYPSATRTQAVWCIIETEMFRHTQDSDILKRKDKNWLNATGPHSLSQWRVLNADIFSGQAI